jgi:hypothetical protein
LNLKLWQLLIEVIVVNSCNKGELAGELPKEFSVEEITVRSIVIFTTLTIPEKLYNAIQFPITLLLSSSIGGRGVKNLYLYAPPPSEQTDASYH